MKKLGLVVCALIGLLLVCLWAAQSEADHENMRVTALDKYHHHPDAA